MYNTLYQLFWYSLLIYSLRDGAPGSSIPQPKAQVCQHRVFEPSILSHISDSRHFIYHIPVGTKSNLFFFLFIGGIILSSALMYITGLLLERFFQRKRWDFSKNRFQFEGYISFPLAVIFGLLGVLCIRVTNPLLLTLLSLIPRWIGRIILAALILLTLDF